MIIAVVVIFVLFVLLIIFSCCITSMAADKYAEISYKQMQERKKKQLEEMNVNLFCLATNKPVMLLNFDTMDGCSPEKCVTCNLSAYRDLD